MTFLANFYEFLYQEGEAPELFGWFHIVSVIFFILTTVLVALWLGNGNDKHVRRFLFVAWLLLVVGEIYREVCFSLDLINGEFSWDYAWYQFPFQLCSSPLYALPFVIFLPDSKLRDGFMSFLTFFSFFGGVAVMIYPSDIFISTIGINIQSIIHHGTQVVIGVLLLCQKKKELSPKYFLRGLYVFFGFVSVAMILNIVGYNLLQANGMDDTFNMYFISPYFDCTLPVLSLVTERTANWVGAPLYVTVFPLIAFIVYTVERLIVKKACK